MTFEQAVKALRPFHGRLWICCESSAEELYHSDSWHEGTITTTGGKILAFQVGHPDEWALTSFFNQPDSGLVIDQPDETSEITQEFVDEVRFFMTTFVHPVHGQPPGTGEF